MWLVLCLVCVLNAAPVVVFGPHVEGTSPFFSRIGPLSFSSP
jgi:hypothetical protein